MRIGSLFSGIGGLDLGLELAGVGEPAWFCEIDPKCQDVLTRHWPDVPVYGDIHEIGGTTSPVDMLVGGFPCQDLSYAGRGAGIEEGTRSGLWSEFARAIRELRPRFVLVENVPALSRRGLWLVCRDLSEAGYDAEWGCLRASEVGTPHRRERIFLLAAHPDRERLTERTERDSRADGPEQQAPLGYDALRCDPAASDAVSIDFGEYRAAVERWESITGEHAPRPTDDEGRLEPAFVEWMMGFPQGWTEGHARTHRLRMLGNAVVPQQCAEAVRRLGL